MMQSKLLTGQKCMRCISNNAQQKYMKRKNLKAGKSNVKQETK